MQERHEYVVLGRIIGTAAGWDQVGDWSINFYEFEPAPGVPLPVAEALFFDSETGLFEAYDDAGNVVFHQDAIVTLLAVPKKEPSNG